MAFYKYIGTGGSRTYPSLDLTVIFGDVVDFTSLNGGVTPDSFWQSDPGPATKAPDNTPLTPPAGPPIATGGSVPGWAATTLYSKSQAALDPNGNLIVRIAGGTSRSTYDATEQAAWTTVSSVGQLGPALPLWTTGVTYTAKQAVQHPTTAGLILIRITSGVARNAFDATEAALWTQAGAATYVAIPGGSDVATVFVTANGNDANDGLTPKSAKATLAAAVAITNGLGGGTVQVGYCPSGLNLSGVTVTQPTVIRGVSRVASLLTNAGTSDDGLTVSANKCVIQDLTIQRTTAAASQTAGAAVVLNSGAATIIERCDLAGWYDNVRVVDAYQYVIRDNYLTNPTRYGVYQQSIAFPDRGDSCVTNNTFDSSLAATYSLAALRIESGGGLKVTANKFLHHVRGIDLQVTDGTATSVMTVTGNSIELQSADCVRLGRAGTTGTYSDLVVSGNQINAASAGAGTGVTVNAGLSLALIAENTIKGSGTSTAISVLGGDGINVGTNSLKNHSVGVNIASGALDVQVAYQKLKTITTAFTDARSVNSGVLGVIDHTYRADLGNITSSTTYTNFYRIDMANFNGAEVELWVNGVVQSGPVVASYRRISLSNASAAVTATIQQTYDANANSTDLQLDVATTGGSVYIGLRRNATGGGTALNGSIEIRCRGRIKTVAPLT